MEIQRESRIDAKRDTILEAATAAFRDDGYECASMDRIAERAKASKRTVYNHFGSKEALFQSVVARLFESVLALKQVVWDPRRPIEDQLADFVRAKTLLSEDQATRCLTRVVLGVYIRQPELLKETVARLADNDTAMVTWLEAAHEAGHLSVPDAALAADLFGKMAAGVLFWPQLLEGPMDADTRDRLAREVIETFLCRYRSGSG